MAAFEVLALDTATPQIRAPGASDTYSFPRAITPSGANVTPITVSGYSLTGANAQSMFDLSGTWNTTGTPTGIKFNITDTASNAASLLMDLQTGGSTRFNVRKDGQVVAGLIAVNSATYSFAGDTTTAWGYRQSGFLAAICSGSEILRIGGGSVDGLSNTIGSSNGGGLGVGSAGVFDVFLRRDAANTLAQRNGVNPQTFNIYNTFTTVSDYERATIAWDTNVCYFAYENGGTGNANRQLRFGARGTTNWFEYSANNGLNVTWSSSTNFSRTRWLNGNIQFDVGTVTSLFGLNTSGTSRLTLADAVNIEVNTTTGTKIGTATSQKLGFWNATPIVQPTTAVAAATVAATGVGDVVAASTTFDGYTIPQIVKALRNAGLLA